MTDGPNPLQRNDSGVPKPVAAQRVEAVLDIIAPRSDAGGDRVAIFEWGHETTPTVGELRALAEQIVDAVMRVDPDGTL